MAKNRTKEHKAIRVLGFDPGTVVTGWGVVDSGATPLLVGTGAIRPPTGAALEERLAAIHERAEALIEEHGPDVVAVEDPFVGRSARSALVLGHARGVLLLAAAQRGLPIAHYAPGAIKRSVAGRGAATKEQVQYMVQRLLGLADPVRPLDASDALAVALCYVNRGLGVAGAKGSNRTKGTSPNQEETGEGLQDVAQRLAADPEQAELIARWKAGRGRRGR